MDPVWTIPLPNESAHQLPLGYYTCARAGGNAGELVFSCHTQPGLRSTCQPGGPSSAISTWKINLPITGCGPAKDSECVAGGTTDSMKEGSAGFFFGGC